MKNSLMILLLLLASTSAMMTTWEYGGLLYVEGYNSPVNTTLTLRAYAGASEVASKTATTDSIGAFTTNFDKSSWQNGSIRVCYGTASYDVCSNTITPESEVSVTQLAQLNDTINTLESKLENHTLNYTNFTAGYNFKYLDDRITEVEDMYLNQNDLFAALRDSMADNYSSFETVFSTQLTTLQTNFTNLSADNTVFKTNAENQLDNQEAELTDITETLTNMSTAFSAGLGNATAANQETRRMSSFNFMMGIVVTLFIVLLAFAAIWHFFLNKQIKRELREEWSHDIAALKRGDVFDAIKQEAEDFKPTKPKETHKICIATTSRGAPCRRPSAKDSDYCAVHKLKAKHGDKYYQ